MKSASEQAPRLTPIERAVQDGLCNAIKTLPAWLLYDQRGSELFEQITALPEYYPTRTERQIFEDHARTILQTAAQGEPLTLIELGAGTADKTRILLRELVSLQGQSTYIPVDVSESALAIARRTIHSELPLVRVEAVLSTTEEVSRTIRHVGGRKLVLFIGSSIGNYDADAATEILRTVHASLQPGDALLLGTDMQKDLGVLLPAYDDAAGVTAAFNKNILTRLNYEVGADFNLGDFRHVARWNEADSRIEMHLQSLREHTVDLAALRQTLHFRQGETIHTESSVKYTLAMVEHMLARAGFRMAHTFFDSQKWFGVHLAHA